MINFHDGAMVGDAAVNMLEYMIDFSPKIPLDYARRVVLRLCHSESKSESKRGAKQAKNYDRCMTIN